MQDKVKCAIIGSGNIGTDLMIKIKRLSNVLECSALVGIEEASEGLARARRMAVGTTHKGIEGLRGMNDYKDIAIVFDATSAKAHAKHDQMLREDGKRIIDLTPAAIGPYVIPTVNMDANLNAINVNMVTCGGQATIPIVAAIGGVTKVHWGEIVASIASKSAGPGTRANIDEFTQTTANAIEQVGGARKGRAVIVLNPAEPPLIMRDTVVCLIAAADQDAITKAVTDMVAQVQEYVPGYRLKQQVQFEQIGQNAPIYIPEMQEKLTGLKVTVFLEVEGAAHYLPAYAGNLDIMTAAAMKTAERIAQTMFNKLVES